MNIKNILPSLAGSKKQVSIGLLTLSLVLGIIFALLVPAIRYTSLVPPKITDINPRDAYQKILSQPEKVLLIDVRSSSEYSKAHASSSLNLPIHYLYDDMHGIPNELGIALPKNKDKEIYLLCTGGRLAGVAYSYLEHYGYRNIKRVEGGLSNWAKSGLPVVIVNPFESIPNGGELDRPLF